MHVEGLPSFVKSPNERAKREQQPLGQKSVTMPGLP